ncbi:hypothetical protein [Couchioplanes caeruleus]|uniref:hypothetical protein n=1 Tax=Couchioplanes caeruleus TaxID=56438 RepID=UPI000AA4C8CE|nr:hypothetical protein [Couchioplanes caeruleus]
MRTSSNLDVLPSLLGVAPGDVPAALSDIVGTPVGAADVRVAPVPYSSGSPATGGLWRIHGDGWSMFVKQLHHLKHWPALSMMPPQIAETFAAELPAGPAARGRQPAEPARARGRQRRVHGHRPVPSALPTRSASTSGSCGSGSPTPGRYRPRCCPRSAR